MNDNFLPLCYMKTANRQTQFVQLWHGAGAFKRFGLSTEDDPSVYQIVKEANQKITHLFVTSENVIPFYQEAFSVPKDKIYPTGIPVTDIYFDQDRIGTEKKNFIKIIRHLRERSFFMRRHFAGQRKKTEILWNSLIFQEFTIY